MAPSARCLAAAQRLCSELCVFTQPISHDGLWGSTGGPEQLLLADVLGKMLSEVLVAQLRGLVFSGVPATASTSSNKQCSRTPN